MLIPYITVPKGTMSTYKQEKKMSGMNTATGIGSGALLGALIGGPIGAILGAVFGGAIGYSKEPSN